MPTKYAFTGQRAGSFGLMDYHARYYSSRLGRFISADNIIPNIMNPLDFDRFSYGVNNPIRYIDPTGHGYCDSPYADPEECAEIDPPYTPDPNDPVVLNYWGNKMYDLYIELITKKGWWNDYTLNNFTVEEFLILILGYEFSPYSPDVLDQLYAGEGFGYDLAHATSHSIYCSPNPSTKECSDYSYSELSNNTILNYVGSRASARYRWKLWNSGVSLNSTFREDASPNIDLATAAVYAIFNPPDPEWKKGDNYTYWTEPSDWGNRSLYVDAIDYASEGTLYYQYYNSWGSGNTAYVLTGCQTGYWKGKYIPPITCGMK